MTKQQTNDIILQELEFMKTTFTSKLEGLERNVSRINDKLEKNYVTREQLQYELDPIKEKQEKADSTSVWFNRTVYGAIIMLILYGLSLTR